MNKSKKLTDIVAMVMVVFAIITGVFLHREVHHLFVYDDVWLWNSHIAVGLIVAIALTLHCIQHKPWFRSYMKIPPRRKSLNSILFIFASLVLLSGIILMCGSHSNFISLLHYVTAIAFTLLTIIHVVQRWKIFINY